MKQTNIQGAILKNIINLLLSGNELVEENEKDYIMMQEDLYKDIENKLIRQGFADVDSLMNDIYDYGHSCKRQMLYSGVKAGIKIMKEIDSI